MYDSAYILELQHCTSFEVRLAGNIRSASTHTHIAVLASRAVVLLTDIKSIVSTYEKAESRATFKVSSCEESRKVYCTVQKMYRYMAS